MSRPITPPESYELTIHQDSFGVVDKLEDMAQEICAVDARLQFITRESFSFTKLQLELARKYSLKIEYHSHDLILYSLLIQDIHVCVFVLLEILHLLQFVAIGEWMVLVDEIYFLYSPFISLYVPDRDTGISWVISLVREARGMYSLHTHLLNSFANKSCHRILF